MKANKVAVGMVGLAMLLGVGALTASAHQGEGAMKGPNYTEERHAAMETIFENEDYTGWLELVGDRGHMAEVITEENFPQFVEAHQLAEAGDYEGARELREELGLRGGPGGMGRGHRGGGCRVSE